jgi:Putative metal-binding motif
MAETVGRSIPGLALAALLVTVGACGVDDTGAGPSNCMQVLYVDSDGDGFGDPGTAMQTCDHPAGMVADDTDCNDDDGSIHPGATEICDGSDNDCDQLVDSADPDVDTANQASYYRDADADGHGDVSHSIKSCDAPAGYVVDSSDCDDAVAAAYPGHAEVCDQIDNDCDGAIDDADDSVDLTGVQPVYADSDGDGFGSGSAIVRCAPPSGTATMAGDCDDADSATSPGAHEMCDGRDNDCDLGIDGTPSAPNQCAGLVRSYTGSYAMSAEEKLGTIVINSMHCNGTTTLTVDLSRTPALQGTVTCHYPGGLGGFEHDQDGTITADVAIDGSFRGTLLHNYGHDLQRTYSITGLIAAGELVIDGMSSMLPHPQSAVPWEVVYSVDAH